MSDQWWRPNDTKRAGGLPEVGDLVAWDYRPWRIVEIHPAEPRDTDEPGWEPHIVVLRPQPEPPAWESEKAHDRHLRFHRRRPDAYTLRVLRDHYGLCAHCGDLMPCRGQEAERAADREIAHMAKYDNPGHCPHCGEVVTHRQYSETYANLVVPGGPPVTFHTGRRKCQLASAEYRHKLTKMQAAQADRKDIS